MAAAKNNDMREFSREGTGIRFEKLTRMNGNGN